MYKQIIIARKDLGMSPGKLAAQVSHGSMEFLTSRIKHNVKKFAKEKKYFAVDISGKKLRPMEYRRDDLTGFAREAFLQGEYCFYVKPVDPLQPDGELELCDNPTFFYEASINLDEALYKQWICGSFTKCVLEARNRNHLLKAKNLAEELGLKQGVDFFLIKDNCYTELEPEEVGEDGAERTLTCIGFTPMDAEIIDKIGKKYQLYK